jgi:hypothetical protein
VAPIRAANQPANTVLTQIINNVYVAMNIFGNCEIYEESILKSLEKLSINTIHDSGI